MNIFWPASFVKFPWHYWTEFSQYWKDLTKTLRSHGNLQWLTDLINGANISTYSNSRDWLFCMLMISKMNPLMNKSMLFWKHVETAFSIFLKSRWNTIPKYEHIIAPHVSSTSLPELYRQCCADLNQHNTVCAILVTIDVLDTCGAMICLYFRTVMKFHRM